MTLPREEIAVRVLCALAPTYTTDASTLLIARAFSIADEFSEYVKTLTPPTVAPVAPPAYVPKAGDVIDVPPYEEVDEFTRVVVSDAEYALLENGRLNMMLRFDQRSLGPPRYLRPSTDAEKRAAGLAVPPPAGKYEPAVGDIVTIASVSPARYHEWWLGAVGVVEVQRPEIFLTTHRIVVKHAPNYKGNKDMIDAVSLYPEYVRLATPSELAAAGLPAPEAKRPTYTLVEAARALAERIRDDAHKIPLGESSDYFTSDANGKISAYNLAGYVANRVEQVAKAIDGAAS